MNGRNSFGLASRGPSPLFYHFGRSQTDRAVGLFGRAAEDTSDLARLRETLALIRLAAVLAALVLCAPVSAQQTPTTPPGAATPPSPTAPAAPSLTGESPAPAKAAAADTASPVGGEVKPPVYYLRDKDGKLVPVLGFKYEDFANLYQKMQALDRPQAAPQYTLSQLTISGQATAERAELTAVFKVLVTTDDWVRVPLRLNKAVLQATEKHEGPGEEFMQFDPAGEGYELWLHGPANSEHIVTLSLLASLTGSGGEQRLDLSLPRAAAAKLTLTVPVAGAAATASAGASAPDVRPAGAAASEISVLGVGGDCWVAWRSAAQPAPRLSSALEATGSMFIRIDARTIDTDCTLTVRSFGQEFDHFQVRLPQGAELVGGTQPGYTLTPQTNHGNNEVEVQLDRKTTGPVDVRLLTERAYDVTRASESLELAGFSISEAIPHRQWGYIAVAVAGDWQLTFGNLTRVRQVGDLPEALRRKEVAASFEYFGEPSSLSVRIAPRRTRVSVEPRYLYEVRGDEATLSARLKYSIRGARLFKLDIDMPGWEIDSVGPEELVDSNGVAGADGAGMSLPLVQPAIDDLELTITARRQLPPGTKLLDWTLPHPKADVIGPADVTIVPASDVALTPQPDKLVALSRVPEPASAPPLDDLPWHEPALYYRGEQGQARFVADFAVHQPDVSIEADQQVTLGNRSSTLDETLTYQIRYVPLGQLTFDVDRRLFDERLITVLVAGQPVELRASGAGNGPDRVRAVLPLAQPVLGTLKIEFRTDLPPQNPRPGESSLLDVPLAVPRDGRLIADLATVVAEPGLRVRPRAAAWQPASGAAGPTIEPLRLMSAAAETVLPLAVSLGDRPLLGATFVDRAWVQTWLTETDCQERVVYQFTSGDEQVRLALPPGIAAADVEVTLDGKRLPPLAGPQGELLVPLPADPQRHEHVLELRYLFAERVPHTGRLSIETPQWKESAGAASPIKVRRTYWQLILPSDETLIHSSSALTPEYDWAWTGSLAGFERVPLKDTRQLEAWVGLTRLAESSTARGGAGRDATDDLPLRTSRYLFSSIGGPPSFEVLVARRWVVLLLASLITLGAGLALLYLPSLRRPRVLAVVAMVLLLAAFIEPELTLLAGQSAILGFALALVALALRRVVRPEATPHTATPSQSGFRLDRSSTRSAFHRPDDVQPTTTASLPVGIDFPRHSASDS